jgi:hypothetical protein
MMRIAGPLLALTLAGCATSVAPPPACPAGHEPLQTAQLFFGRNIGANPGVSQAQFQEFVDQEITPRFPKGLTVLDGGGQWRGDANVLIREASKVVVLVLPQRGADRLLDEVRRAYKARFSQDSVLLVIQDSCVSF